MRPNKAVESIINKERNKKQKRKANRMNEEKYSPVITAYGLERTRKRQKIELENDHVEQSLSITFNQDP